MQNSAESKTQLIPYNQNEKRITEAERKATYNIKNESAVLIKKRREMDSQDSQRSKSGAVVALR